ncbi:hypothetical protein [Tenacibaculum sp. nBUS_03]|uniref:hypothetical protein n=1 Tax=Tenacibaculum sp. nBUS_03 TaxID=3395320 RepID=UPI003EC0EB14
MKKSIYLLRIIALSLLFHSCATATKIKENKYTTNHTFKVIFNGIDYQLCKGRTALCPKECGNSGEIANFDVIEYVSLTGKGEAQKEELKNFSIQVSDYSKNRFSEGHISKIENLNLKDEVILEVVFVYDTSLTDIKTERRIISIETVN